MQCEAFKIATYHLNLQFKWSKNLQFYNFCHQVILKVLIHRVLFTSLEKAFDWFK